jgi:hypothetical protein
MSDLLRFYVVLRLSYAGIFDVLLPKSRWAGSDCVARVLHMLSMCGNVVSDAYDPS